jgi:hypothetical protein
VVRGGEATSALDFVSSNCVRNPDGSSSDDFFRFGEVSRKGTLRPQHPLVYRQVGSKRNPTEPQGTPVRTGKCPDLPSRES